MVVGGNPDLKAETSDSWTAGVVFQPAELGILAGVYLVGARSGEHRRGSLDRIHPGRLLQLLPGPVQCVLRPHRAPAGCRWLPDRCGRIAAERRPAGRPGRRYRLPLREGIRTLRPDHRRHGDPPGVAAHATVRLDDWDSVGNWGYPKWVAETDFRIDYRDWTFFWRARMVGKSHEDPVFDPGTANRDRPTSTGQRMVSLRHGALAECGLGRSRDAPERVRQQAAPGSRRRWIRIGQPRLQHDTRRGLRPAGPLAGSPGGQGVLTGGRL